jgi:Kef-type K+ transport system membrane component KefB
VEDNPAIGLFLALGIIILASRLAGSFTRRFGQPRVLGELVVGVILGPTLLDLLHASIFHGVDLSETIHELAELGVLLLMFIVGLEVEVKELARVGRVAVFAGFLGAILPVVLTFPIALAFGYEWSAALFAGVTLAATSVSISAQVLLELGYLRTQEGNALLATALVDDILAILLVSLTIAITSPASEAASGELFGIIVRMALYLVVAFATAWFVLPRLMNWFAENPRLSQAHGVAALSLVLMLMFAWSAEALGGVAAITGAFLAGVGISQANERVEHIVEEAASHIAYAFLVPVFFVAVGLQTDLSAFPLSALPFAALLLAGAVASKIIGCGLGARMGGFDQGASFRVGVCMISRGEVGIIIASLGLSSGVLAPEQPLFAALFLVILLTTVLAPPLVRWVFKSKPEEEPPLLEGAETT